MNEFSELLKPQWGAEKWILEGWNKINSEEKALIKDRMHDLFKEGLPFELKHDKLLYIYTFSLLAQLEVLAIQVPLRFEEKMSTPQFKQQMHIQLLDEIFHGMVFTKIVYLLCAPHALPPTYNLTLEKFCNLIRNEECHKVGVVLLNLVAEGWLEELFLVLHQQHIAPKVFEMILQDEHRHVCEADLYRDIGMPSKAILKQKLEGLEESFLTSFIAEPQYISALSGLLGVPVMEKYLQSLNEKHMKQLKKIELTPSEGWRVLLQTSQDILTRFNDSAANKQEIELTPIRKVCMTQWNSPGDPTMVGQFNMDISCLDIFSKKYPAETLATLMLQATSQILADNDLLRRYLSYKKLYQIQDAYAAIVVKLPGCGDHISTIIFKNCHLMAVPELSLKIRQMIRMMTYCYKKREELEQRHPHLKQDLDSLFFDVAHNEYPYPVPGGFFVSLSNIGVCGYSQASSPLRKQEGWKLTLLTPERKSVWNHDSQSFEIKDILPVSVTADHRIFDGNIYIPKLLNNAFQNVFEQMQQSSIKPIRDKWLSRTYFTKMLDQFVANDLDVGYRVMTMLQTLCPEFMDIQGILNLAAKKAMFSQLEAWIG